MTSAALDPKAACEMLACCPACERDSHAALPLPGHWIGGEWFAGLKDRLGLVRCRACGLVYANPRPSEHELGAYYAGDTYECHETAGSASAGAKADFLLDRIERRLPSEAPRKLLDYGAGGGGFLLHARSRGWDVNGFEPGRRGWEACRGLGLDVVADAEELPSGAFGLVTLHHVFEHLADPVGVLGEIRRLLAPGGRLFIEVPNAASLRARLSLPLFSRRFGFDERYRAFPIHLMYYKPATLRAMLAKAGWKVKAMFTAGLGVDEIFARSRPRTASKQRQAGQRGTSRPRKPARKRLRHIVRDCFLGMGFGENLAAVAAPVD